MDLFNPALDENITFVRPTFFYVSGFDGIPDTKYYFVFLCFVFIVSILGNGTVMFVIFFDRCLQTPKYIAVFNLAFVDLVGNTSVVPMLLYMFLFDHQYIPYNNCLSSMFFNLLFLSMQTLNLTVLSYDRVMAITFPLRYHALVTIKSMFILTAVAWFVAILLCLVATGLITRLSFCRSVQVKSYYCDHGPVFRLACNDFNPSDIIGFISPVLMLWLPMCLITVGYGCIGYAILRLPTNKDRLKAINTCTAHMILVAMFYLPIIVTFSLGAFMSTNARILNLSLASILVPTLNPIVYVLKTEEVKASVKKQLKMLRGVVVPRKN
ncbi:olfactory receptor 1J1-like [Aplochiton taeniatus]